MLNRVWPVAVALLAAGASSASAETLDVYSSLPLQGASHAQTRAAVKGMKLALSQAGGRAGAFHIRYRSLDDSTRAAGNWDPGAVARNARRAAQDDKTILYLGEFNSGGSAISIPILNQANISQISPSNTYAGLTIRSPASCCGEPDRYYPAGRRTFVRLPPNDSIQSAALVTQMRTDGCTRLAIASDGDTYGDEIAGWAKRTAARLGMIVAHYRRSTYRVKAGKIAAEVAQAGADCFLFGGVTANRAVPIFKAVGKRLPSARLYGGDGVCESGFTRPARNLAARFRCTVAPLALSDYPGGPAFGAALGNSNPDPYAIYGYEAMKLGLDTITGLGAKGNRREAVRKALFATTNRESVLGTYSITSTGDTTIRDYGVYGSTPAGRLVYDHKVVAE